MHLQIIYKYEEDLAWNNLQGFICHKTEPNQIKLFPTISEVCLILHFTRGEYYVA